MQWAHQPTSLVHVSSPTPSRQPPLRTKGATTTLRKTHSEQGPGGGLGWGRHSRVQGHREHSLEGRWTEVPGGHTPLASGIAHSMGRATDGRRGLEKDLPKYRGWGQRGQGQYSALVRGAPESRTGMSGQELEGKVCPRELSSLVHKFVCPALNSSASPTIHKIMVAPLSPLTQYVQKYNLPSILHKTSTEPGVPSFCPNKLKQQNHLLCPLHLPQYLVYLCLRFLN